LTIENEFLSITDIMLQLQSCGDPIGGSMPRG